jgi:hypothetical protein
MPRKHQFSSACQVLPRIPSEASFPLYCELLLQYAFLSGTLMGGSTRKLEGVEHGERLFRMNHKRIMRISNLDLYIGAFTLSYS